MKFKIFHFFFLEITQWGVSNLFIIPKNKQVIHNKKIYIFKIIIVHKAELNGTFFSFVFFTQI